jgi:adenosylmethionine-8-amino-7-oxononanoate aminotransferase
MSLAAQRDIRHILHPWQHLSLEHCAEPLIIERAEGAYVFDSRGRRYLDAVGGLWCNAVGFGRGDMATAIHEQIKRLSFANSFVDMGNPRAAELAERLCEHAPQGINRVIFTTGGSTAVESAIRLAHFYWSCRGKAQKRHLLALRGGYHGSTYMAASLTGREDRAAEFAYDTSTVHLLASPKMFPAHDAAGESDFCNGLIEDFERQIARLGAECVAAYIAEPILGSGGVVVPPHGYHVRVRELCRRYEILYIADEVVTGMGRVGEWFASHSVFGVIPDVIVSAKCLTSGYLPLGAALYSDEIHAAIAGSPHAREFAHGFTNSGHPVSCVAALKVIDIFEREQILRNVCRTGAYFEHRLRRLLEFPIVGEVRGMRMMIGVEYVADRVSRTPFPKDFNVAGRVSQLAERRGLLVRSCGHVNIISPCLASTPEQVDCVVDVLADSLDELCQSFNGC